MFACALIVRRSTPPKGLTVEQVEFEDLICVQFPSGDWTDYDIPNAARRYEGKFVEISFAPIQRGENGEIYLSSPTGAGWSAAERTMRIKNPRALPIPVSNCVRVSGTLHIRYQPLPPGQESRKALWEIELASIQPEVLTVPSSPPPKPSEASPGVWIAIYCPVVAILLLLAGRVRARLLAIEWGLNGCCEVCGYDLRASQSDRCPECGSAVVAPRATRRNAGLFTAIQPDDAGPAQATSMPGESAEQFAGCQSLH